MADRRELYSDPIEAQRAAIDAQLAHVWTALPGIVQSFDPATMTVSVQPAIKAKHRAADGTTSDVNLPLCVDVPVSFPGGGGHTLTFPIAAGDECLLTFSSRCIDGWWKEGGVQPQLDQRRHDLSDAVAHVGIRSKAKALSGVSADSTQLRSDDGATVLDFKGGQMTLTTAKLVINSADVQITGASLKHNGHDIGSTHKHTSVQTGGGISGPPQ